MFRVNNYTYRLSDLVVLRLRFVNLIYKKARSLYQLLAPLSEAVGIAQFVRTSNHRPPRQYDTCTTVNMLTVMHEKSYPWASNVAMLFDEY